MGIYNQFCINKSGKTYNIYDSDTNTYQGKISDREAFIYLGGEGTLYYLGFLNSSGKIQKVTIQEFYHPFPDGFFGYCTDYPYSREVINGVNYYIYKMRQTKNVYTADGNYWGRVASGMYVATTSNTVGETHCDWKLINYVKSTSGKWVQVSGAGCNYGFVDTGLSSSSLPGSIAMYGSW